MGISQSHVYPEGTPEPRQVVSMYRDDQDVAASLTDDQDHVVCEIDVRGTPNIRGYLEHPGPGGAAPIELVLEVQIGGGLAPWFQVAAATAAANTTVNIGGNFPAHRARLRAWSAGPITDVPVALAAMD